MILFGGILSIKAISFLVFSVFIIAGLGYLLGRITINGISLGTAGVFIVALLYGAFLYSPLQAQLLVGGKTYVTSALKIVENLGLILFVTSVGFIAGPSFFGDFKRNFKSYIVLGLLIIVMGGLSCAGCIVFDNKVFGRNLEEVSAMLVGLLSGSLTSTPAFSAAKATVTSESLEAIVAVGHGIAYLFGVVGVVLFVQLVPKLARANMEEERAKLSESAPKAPSKLTGNEMEIDPFGFGAFSVVAVLGICVGSFKFGNFSLTTTGGCLLVSLICGHFMKIGNVSIMPQEGTLKVFRELGLMLFLIGAGVAGGASFVKYFEWVYFIYGIIMTLVPMIIGFIFARYVLKLNLLNNLGSICGGMTSTPALGTLISTAGTEQVAGAYASTYPIALIAVVIVSQLLIIFFR
ncbi:putative permease [Treponema sp. JC4]|uniref:aspartate-alanine antiporter-like transporter n=1 Tax=Treponema sp. JC4 TaxID=1124982 RepID=UPI00025B0315|nr:permease [Treponema sp. JC4]EID84555.1 putative permease [Treponema sp. JC4]